MKVVMNDPKTGKSYQKELDKHAEGGLVGKKISDEFNGELIDLQGYKFKITGGSDKSGIPMRPEIKGRGKKKKLLTRGIGFRNKRKGLRRKKSVRGHVISPDISQVNAKIIKYGKAKLDLIFKKKESEGEKK